MSKPWALERTQQCAKCPWRVDTNPFDIPDNYSLEKHTKLDRTIAKGSVFEQLAQPTLRVMSCHEELETPCIGWLMNQLGPGNNIRLRILIRDCINFDAVKLIGAQHKRFEDTLPENKI